MKVAALLAALVASVPSRVGSHVETGNSSVFAYRGDRWQGGRSPCLGRQVRPTDRVVAHRTLPCGTVVRVTNLRTGLATVATVGNRGPFGACLDDDYRGGIRCEQWTVKRRRSDPGRWRGLLDVTPAVAAAIEHDGWDRVRVEVIR